MSRRSLYQGGCLCALLWLSATVLFAQQPKPEPAKAKPPLPTIADEPKTNDPAAFLPAGLAKAAKVQFKDSSLRELLAWLRENQKLVVLLDGDALADIRVLPGDPITDRLDGAPVYLLLDRLRSLGLAWYFDDEILHVTSQQVTHGRLTMIPYNVGDLLDAKYDRDGLGEMIKGAVYPASWDDGGGAGVVSFLGDVMFVRQTDDLHRHVRGLLAALRKHGRRTFALDPPQHEALRQKLAQNVTVAFRDTPLEAAVASLAEKTQTDIRLDWPALHRLRVREREPVTLSLTDRNLKTVLRAMLLDLELTWVLRDGVLWITGREEAAAFLKTAVYDVRDLCRDRAESDALRDAIISQTEPVWDDSGGMGTIQFAQPGTMVVHNTEDSLDEVLNLLETYRAALRASKPRLKKEDDPTEVITVYYRMHAGVAQDLAALLPKMVRPESWKSAARPDAPGELFRAASSPEVSELAAGLGADPQTQQSAQKLVLDRAVLIIRQARGTHAEIEKVIARVQYGDAGLSGPGGGMGGGMGGGAGGGGFGGAFFRVPPEKNPTAK